MTKLTKDNLLSLLKCVHLTEIDHGECADLDDIKCKLQFMIDNYCDHEELIVNEYQKKIQEKIKRWEDMKKLVDNREIILKSIDRRQYIKVPWIVSIDYGINTGIGYA